MKRWFYPFFTWAICLGLPMGVLAQATVEGIVELPKSTEIAVPDQRYTTQTTKTTSPITPPGAVVYLDGSFPKKSETGRPSTAQMAQKNLQFVPGLLPIQVGTTVEFPNFDDLYHNVFSYSKIKRFDLGRYRKDEKPATLVFDKPGVVKIYCEIHEHMRGTILVLETPYFVKTDADGKFVLKDLPAGKYVLKAWVDEKNIWEQAVELNEKAALKIDFTKKP